jgi:hypothetical protein
MRLLNVLMRNAIGFEPLSLAFILPAFLLLVLPRPAQGQKTDVVTLRNGDEVTGEMKWLERGLLKFSTDGMRTVYVEWTKVVTADTDKTFEIVLRDGTIHVGSLKPGGADSVVIVTDSVSVAASTKRVVRLTRIKRGFWASLDGNLKAGFDYTQQNNKMDLRIGGEVSYIGGAGVNRGLSWRAKGATLTRLDFNSTFSRQEGTDEISRLGAKLLHARQYGKGWFYLGFLSGARNSQLSLEFRTSIGGGLGRLLVESNTMDLALWLAPAFAREQFTGQSGASSFPLVLAADFLLFIWEPLDTEVDSQLAVLPILGEGGRWRIDFSLTATREVIKDVDISIGLRELFDSRPPADANKNDFNLTTSFGWSF